jgi:ribosomal protein S18 acetylase RimI-like enzyme
MTASRPELVENRASGAEILIHLARCDARFVPPLSDRVDLGPYARRLYEKAHRFEAWASGELIGLVAAYFNDEDGEAFISNVSVDEGFQGRGIASALLARAVANAGAAGLTRVHLHVGTGNFAARHLFEKLGFRVCLVQGEQALMRLDLPGNIR